MNEPSSILDCHWYVGKQESIVPTGNEYNDIHKWPGCIYT